MDKKGEIYDLHEEIFNNGPLLKLTHEECEQLASFLVETGYRKASDVAEEIADFIWEKDIADTLIPINGRYLSKQDFIAELKKKYESEVEK